MTLSRELQALAKIAMDQGWTVEEKSNGKVTWRSPDKTVPLIHSDSRAAVANRGVANFQAELVRNGLLLPGRIGQDLPSASVPTLIRERAPEVQRLAEAIADLLDEEIDTITKNLQDQVQMERDRASALANENADLKARLKESEEGLERRVKDAAMAAAEAVLNARRP